MRARRTASLPSCWRRNTDAVSETYGRFTLQWSDIIIDVSFRANWLNTDHWHIELRADQPLPVTETGYRSQFVPMTDLEDEAAIREFVLFWLDDGATRPDWQRFVADSRQLKLF